MRAVGGGVENHRLSDFASCADVDSAIQISIALYDRKADRSIFGGKPNAHRPGRYLTCRWLLNVQESGGASRQLDERSR